MDDLYDNDITYNQSPKNVPHEEISNKKLKILYILNIVLCVLTIMLSINEVVINADCVVCSDTTREACYWLAILAIFVSLICLAFNIFALLSKSGYTHKVSII